MDVYVHRHVQNQAWHTYTLKKYMLNKGWGDGGVYFCPFENCSQSFQLAACPFNTRLMWLA